MRLVWIIPMLAAIVHSYGMQVPNYRALWPRLSGPPTHGIWIKFARTTLKLAVCVLSPYIPQLYSREPVPPVVDSGFARFLELVLRASNRSTDHLIVAALIPRQVGSSSDSRQSQSLFPA